MRSSSSPLNTAAIEDLWRGAAAAIGFRVERTDGAYATSDGGKVISIGADHTLDADDAVAQLVFHELCHALTEGEAGRGRPDWGLDNVPEHAVREHACLRLQAAIAGRFGLRALMAPTTPYRAYYDALAEDALAGDADPAAPVARAAVARYDASPWRAPIEGALAASAALVAAPVASDMAGLHPLGFPLGTAGERCGTCAWFYTGGRGTPVTRCRQSAPVVGDGARTDADSPACARWERPVACQACGACCREAYHSVTVSVRDPVVWQEPQLIVRHGHRFEIRRDGERCAALAEERLPPERAEASRRFACTIYEHRPRTCREFTAGGRHCLEARRRVGLSAGAA